MSLQEASAATKISSGISSYDEGWACKAFNPGQYTLANTNETLIFKSAAY